MNSLLEKLNSLINHFEKISKLINESKIINNTKQFIKLNKEYHELKKILFIQTRYKQVLTNIAEAQTILANESDIILRELAKDELEKFSSILPQLEEEIKLLLIQTDPQDPKNAIIEIRSGTGGDEAAIFSGDLYKMYSKYCEFKGWKIEVTNSSEGTIGGFKEIIFTVSGENVYGTLKYESGVHRVQRIPITETQGRVHTSAATVAIFPEAEDMDIEIKESDVRTDVFCSSGPGGQSVNTTYSAIRLTHIPTGIVVQCQDERSQLKNKEKAMTELRARIYNMEYQKQLNEIASKRRIMISTGDRSAKIRTYNYPQNRVTDHRINYTIYNLSSFLEGNIQKIIDQLIIKENSEKLKEFEF